MITFYQKDNIFNYECDAIINPVNTVGVMGKGLALVFKQKYPKNFEFYKQHCLNNQFQIGKILTYKENDIFIFNFPTKKHWRDPSQISYIKEGLISLKEEILYNQIRSINIPALGCGLGGLEWSIVKEILIDELCFLDCDIRIFEPHEA